MANFLGALGYAREGAFFKKEQEADLQRHVERLKEEGVIRDDSGNRNPPRTISFDQSTHNFEASFQHPPSTSVFAIQVLGEILQQGARLNAPQAALLQEYEKRVKGKLPPLTEEEYREWRRRIGPLGLATISAIRVPSNKYTSLQQGLRQPYYRSLPPEAAEAARRQFTVALRGLVYGSMIGMMTVASFGAVLCWYNDVHDLDDVRPLLQSWALPLGQSFRHSITPFKGWAQRMTSKLKVSKDSLQEEEGPKYETEFSRALKRKFTSGR